jgi:hypothetical protein
MGHSTSSRQATGQDFEAVVETLARAFADDPVWGGWALPDRSQAFEHRRAIFGLWVKRSLLGESLNFTRRS